MPRLNTSEIHSEIQLIKKDVEFLRESQVRVQADIAEIKKTLLDPDNGAIARVNKNTEFRKVASAALWSIWLTMLGVLAKLIFWE
jgi:hypothetical protein